MIIPFLKYINSIPFPFTIRHYYAPAINLKHIDTPEDWDLLRLHDDHFTISESREEWLKSAEGLVKKDGQSGAHLKFSDDVANYIKKMPNIKHVFSVGVGGGGLEYQIKKKLPYIKLTCSEYAPKSVEMLKKVFIEADEIIEFDIKKQWPKISDDTLVIINRVEPHLTNAEWKDVFKKCGAKNVLFIPNTFVTIRGIFNRIFSRIKNWKKNYVFGGHLRSKMGFISFWEDIYDYTEINFYGYTGFLLNKKSSK